jgi:hypothetical protein
MTRKLACNDKENKVVSSRPSITSGEISTM